MIENVQRLWKEIKEEAAKVSSKEQLQTLKSSFLGKKGEVSTLLKNLKDKTEKERREIGERLNKIKTEAIKFFEEKFSDISKSSGKQSFDVHNIDITLPLLGSRGKERIAESEKIGMESLGLQHPLSKILEETISFFEMRGFVSVSGMELESEYYNFEALNIPQGHPARKEQDSFYIDEKHVLRTQTSNMQIRVGQNTTPPIAIVSPGKVFRRDTVDATHSYFFHQIEGLLIDEKVSFAHLKGLLTDYCKTTFGNDINLRFRPDFFPFTEPSCEIAIEYAGRDEGWLEILGAGAVHPQVIKNMGISPEDYQGLAFGIGIERIAMLKYGINDIRFFYENDLAFLNQFS